VFAKLEVAPYPITIEFAQDVVVFALYPIMTAALLPDAVVAPEPITTEFAQESERQPYPTLTELSEF
jgi:hypothetical protein